MSILKNKDPKGELIHQLEKIKNNAKPLLAKIPEVFPEYTAHDIGHKEKVLEKMRLVLPDSLANEMNKYEIFCLISAVYLHDIGMANLPELLPQNMKEELEDEISEHIRKNHHIRVEEFIQKNYSNLGIEDHHQARIIGRISRGHRKENLFDQNLFDFNEVYKDVSINVPLLASLLRIADELDMTFERTPMIVYEKKPPKDPISKLEWKKHLSVSGVTLHPDDSLTIISKARCETPKIHRLLKDLEKKVNNELDALPYHLHHYRKLRKDIPRKFLINIQSVGYEPKDIKFTLNEKQIFSLLMGDKLYKSKEDSIREILKNSIDACKLQQDILSNENRDYEPKIIVNVNDDNSILTISDNGVGMDEDIIERYFTKIGISFYQSNEFSNISHEFNPVGELGIGTLACFMISDKVIVDTKMESSEALLLEIDGVSDYFFVKDSERKETGTKMTLILKEEFKQKLDIIEIIRYFIRHCEIPIKIIHKNKETIIEKKDYRLDESLFKIKNNYNIKPKLLHLDLDENFIKGSVGLCGKEEDGDWVPLGDKYAKYESDSNRMYVSKEGIFVSHEKILPDWISANNIYADLDIKNNSLDLEVSRDAVVQNKKFEEIQEKLDKIFEKHFEEIFLNFKNKLGEYTSAFLINQFFQSYITDFFRLERSERDLYITKKEKKIRPFVIEFYKNHYPYWKATKDGLKPTTVKELKKNGKPIIVITGIRYRDQDYIKKLFTKIKKLGTDTNYILGGWDLHYLTTYKEKHYTSFFNMERIYDLDEILPKTWQVVKIKDFETDTLFEYYSTYNKTLVNKDNKFITYLIENIDKMTEEQKMMLEAFFKTIKTKARRDFQEIINSQRTILTNFVENRLLNEEEVNSLLITPDDVKFRG